jgi:hypothetical protein
LFINGWVTFNDVLRGVKIMNKISSVLVALFGSATVLLASPDAQALTSGNTVYVPIYSHVYHGNMDWTKKPETKQMAVMVSVRNIDQKNPITVTSIKYFGSDGKLIRDETAKAKTLAPLATMELFVENKDATGGAGANYIITFKSDVPVDPPIIEALHTNFWAPGSVVFTTRGEVIQAQ